MIDKAHLTTADDLLVGDWIRDALDPWGPPFSVGIVIPGGFEAYVLVRHKGLGDGHGELGSVTLVTLLNTLAGFTSTPEDCFHALWEGQGWMHPGAIATFMPYKPSKLSWFYKLKPIRPIKMRLEFRRIRRRTLLNESPPINTLPDGILSSPRFTLPNRNYLLMRGSIKEALKIGYEQFDRFRLQSPNLIWPSDKSWILATEIDLNATLIGGSIELVHAIMQNDNLVSEIFSRSNNSVDLGFHDF